MRQWPVFSLVEARGETLVGTCHRRVRLLFFAGTVLAFARLAERRIVSSIASIVSLRDVKDWIFFLIGMTIGFGTHRTCTV